MHEVMKSDIEIAQQAEIRPIADVAREAGLLDDELELYGRFKAKVRPEAFARLQGTRDGKLVILTSMTPTLLGEGKTTTAIGLGQALCRLGERAVVAIREAAMGPVFGAKGGAAGGGYSQVLPMEDINLHFTGDFHAITSANNLLAAVIDNHLQQGNTLNIDSRRVIWRRCLDVNDRALRETVTGLGGHGQGVPRETGFDITPASEVMAVLCLSEDLDDLKHRLNRIVIGYTFDRKPVTVAELKVGGAVTALLRDALNPNLVQTLEGGPALVHGGPFGNIAHGTNSIRATRLALKLGQYALVETGFGSDLGFEKFWNIVARQTGLRPDGAVVVASLRALKLHGGVDRRSLINEDICAVRRGLPNLLRHIRNVQHSGVKCLVAINLFPTDTEAEIAALEEALGLAGVPCARSNIFSHGGAGGEKLAKALIAQLHEGSSEFRLLYPDEMPLREKIVTIGRKVYGADGVDFAGSAPRDLARFEAMGFGNLPVCMAKTQYSFSDDSTRLNAPDGFRITVRSARLSAGAGFIVALTGDIMTMPGLGAEPAAHRIDVLSDGRITGLS